MAYGVLWYEIIDGTIRIRRWSSVNKRLLYFIIKFNYFFYFFIFLNFLKRTISEQMEYSNLIGKKTDDVQVIFAPSLQHCTYYGFKFDNNNCKEAYAAFQLLIKPGAYSVSSYSPEWSTKETGAIALHSLLLQLHDF